MTKRQIEELAKITIDLGKLVFASLVLGFFNSELNREIILAYVLVGLTMSIVLFIIRKINEFANLFVNEYNWAEVN